MSSFKFVNEWIYNFFADKNLGESATVRDDRVKHFRKLTEAKNVILSVLEREE